MPEYAFKMTSGRRPALAAAFSEEGYELFGVFLRAERGLLKRALEAVGAGEEFSGNIFSVVPLGGRCLLTDDIREEELELDTELFMRATADYIAALRELKEKSSQ